MGEHVEPNRFPVPDVRVHPVQQRSGEAAAPVTAGDEELPQVEIPSGVTEQAIADGRPGPTRHVAGVVFLQPRRHARGELGAGHRLGMPLVLEELPVQIGQFLRLRRIHFDYRHALKQVGGWRVVTQLPKLLICAAGRPISTARTVPVSRGSSLRLQPIKANSPTFARTTTLSSCATRPETSSPRVRRSVTRAPTDASCRKAANLFMAATPPSFIDGLRRQRPSSRLLVRSPQFSMFGCRITQPPRMGSACRALMVSAPIRQAQPPLKRATGGTLPICWYRSALEAAGRLLRVPPHTAPRSTPADGATLPPPATSSSTTRSMRPPGAVRRREGPKGSAPLMMASLSTGSEAYCQGADAMNLAPRQPIGQAVEALMGPEQRAFPRSRRPPGAR